MDNLRKKLSQQDLENLGLELKALRESLNISQEDMAYDYNISPLTWIKYERGKTQIKPNLLYKLSQDYGFTSKYFPDKEDKELTIGERLTRFRNKEKISIDSLAKNLNVTPEVLMSFENNKRFQMYLYAFTKLVEMYKLNLNWLFTGKGNMKNT